MMSPEAMLRERLQIDQICHAAIMKARQDKETALVHLLDQAVRPADIEPQGAEGVAE